MTKDAQRAVDGVRKLREEGPYSQASAKLGALRTQAADIERKYQTELAGLDEARRMDPFDVAAHELLKAPNGDAAAAGQLAERLAIEASTRVNGLVTQKRLLARAIALQERVVEEQKSAADLAARAALLPSYREYVQRVHEALKVVTAATAAEAEFRGLIEDLGVSGIGWPSSLSEMRLDREFSRAWHWERDVRESKLL